MDFTLFHTAKVHRARFDRLRDRIAPGAGLTHVVRPDWLTRAQGGMEPALRDEIAAEIAAATGPSLCSCTTIGEVAEGAGALRIDRPVMQAAAAIGGHLCLAYCLDSTAQASRALLQEAADRAGGTARITPLPLQAAWAAFEAGDMAGYATAIADGVRAHLVQHPDTAAIVLAQASMDVAAPALDGVGVPVLATPELAFRALVGKHIQ